MKTLSMKQREAARLLASGASNNDVASQLAIDPATLYRWKGKPEFSIYLRMLAECFEREAENRLYALKGKAVERLAKLLDNQSSSVAIKAIEMVIGRSCSSRFDNKNMCDESQSSEVYELKAALALRLKEMAKKKRMAQF